MSSPISDSRLARSGFAVTILAAATLALPSLLTAQETGLTGSPFILAASSLNLAVAPASAASAPAGKIPPGTILPVILRTSFSFQNSKPGEILRGEIAQAVPLPDGSRIRKGTRIEGHIISVTPAGNGTPTKLSLNFDKLYLDGRTISVVTNLRAIAGFMDVQAAGVPTEPPNEGSPYEWLARRQIGGDSKYGLNGKVMSEEDP